MDATEFLTTEEDSFALAVVEYGGNLRDAYIAIFGSESSNPFAEAQRLLAKPAISVRVQELLASANQASLISVGSHLAQLAEIRDLSKSLKQPKAALQAEMARGEVAGFYKKHVELPDGVDPELLKNATKLKEFVGETIANLANNLPV